MESLTRDFIDWCTSFQSISHSIELPKTECWASRFYTFHTLSFQSFLYLKKEAFKHYDEVIRLPKLKPAALMAIDVWTDILSDETASGHFSEMGGEDSLTLRSLGCLGTLNGVVLFTDGFRDTDSRLLEFGEIYIGHYTDILSLMGTHKRERLKDEFEAEGNLTIWAQRIS